MTSVKRGNEWGLRAGLPLWAAEELGARRALALNVLNTPGFRLLHHVMRGKRASATLEVVRVEPFERMEGREAWHTPWGGPPDVRSITEDFDAVYANVHVGVLLDNLRKDTGRAELVLRGFVNGFVKSIPSGKQNSFKKRRIP